MELSVRAIDPGNHPDFGGLVEHIDLRAPLPGATIAGIEAAMDRFAVLVFRHQALDDAQQIAFTQQFGELELAIGDVKCAKDRRLRAEVNDISNLDKDNQRLAAGRQRFTALYSRLWHTDSSYRPTAARYSLLSARIIPSAGGDTEFADMRAAYDALGEETRRMIDGLICEHDVRYTQAQLGFTEADFSEEERRQLNAFISASHPLVRRHPRTDRRSLYLSSHASSLKGSSLPEARLLLRDLTQHATQREFVYVHRWQAHDLIMWDNRVTMHRGRPYDENQTRDLHRTTVTDSAPTLEQPAREHDQATSKEVTASS